MDIKKTLLVAKRSLQKNSPAILTGMATLGVVSTALLTGRSTIKAISILHDAAEDDILVEETFSHFTPKEILQLTWKAYLPPVITGVMTVGCIIGAQSINTRRTAALASLYTLSETALKEYKEKVVEVVGEKKEKAIRDEVASDKVKKNPVSERNIIITGKGDQLIFDAASGRYFRSTIEKVRKAMNDANHTMFQHMNMSLNEWYTLIGLGHIAVGDFTGWTIEDPIDVYFSSTITDDGEPCIVLEHDQPPYSGFRDFVS